MTIVTVTLDDTKIGTIVGAPDQYITRFELVRSQSPVYQIDGWQVLPYPHGDFGGGGRLILREGDGLGRRILNFNPTYHQSPALNGASLRYWGGLMLESCPKGAEYRLDLSDTPVISQAA